MPATAKITKYIYASKGARTGLVKSMTEVLVRVTASAKSNCPIDQGQLANSIMWKLDGKSGGFNDGTVSGSGGTTAGGNARAGTGDSPAPDREKLTINDEGRAASGNNRFIGYAGTNSDHWYPEFGTRWMIAQPFLRPAKSEVVDGYTPQQIGVKYGREAMQREFMRRKEERKNV